MSCRLAELEDFDSGHRGPQAIGLGTRMAAMQLVDPRVTYAELEQWPDDGCRYELYRGEAIAVPTPLPIHQVVVLRVYGELRRYAEATQGLVLGAPLDIVFSEYDVLQPDLVFFDAHQRRQIDLHSAIRIVPRLVVEVLSRSTAARDRGRKVEIYARLTAAGVPLQANGQRASMSCAFRAAQFHQKDSNVRVYRTAADPARLGPADSRETPSVRPGAV